VQYSEEELVAEMGAAMLCGLARIDSKVIENQASYIENWLKRLKDDPKLLVSAAGQAQKASDYIVGVTWAVPAETDEEKTEDSEKVLVAA
jgi:antirestriction protein ArdC